MQVERVSTKTFYVTFVTQLGEEATVSGTPTFTMKRVTGDGTVNTIVNQEDLTLDSGSSYYFRHSFGPSASLGSYTSLFEATFSDGTEVIGTEDFKVLEKGALSTKAGGFTSKVIQVFNNEERKSLLKSARQVDKLVGFSSAKGEMKGVKEDLAKVLGEFKELSEMKKILSEMDKDKKQVQIMTGRLDENRKALKQEMQKLYEGIKLFDSKSELRSGELEKLVIKGLSDEALEELVDETRVTPEGTHNAKRKRKE